MNLTQLARHALSEDEAMKQGKVFEIPKALVWQSYQQVRKNNGAAGCDGQTLKEFDQNRDRNLYKIWNRLTRTGKLFRVCMPGASKKAMKEITKTIRSWRIHRGTAEDARQLALRYNAIIRGWITYYGKHWYRNFSYRLWTGLQSRLIKWVEAKYRLSVREATRRLNLMKKEIPRLFAHWDLLRASTT